MEAGPHLRYLLKGLSRAERRALQELQQHNEPSDHGALFELKRKGILIEDQGELRSFSMTFTDLVVAQRDSELSPREQVREFERLM